MINNSNNSIKLILNHIKILLTLLSSFIIMSCGTGVPASSPAYTPFYCPNTTNVAFPGVSGIRQVSGESTVYITGVYVQYGANHAFLYKGPILGGGVCNAFNYPTSESVTVTATSLYGPDNGSNGNIVVVGSYTTLQTGADAQLGLLYQGAADGSTESGYLTLNPSSLTSDTVINTLGHSVMNGIVVGNYDTNIASGNAFIYNINTESYYNLTKQPIPSMSITAYGIWWNGSTSYTITGGYSDVNESGMDIGYILDWDSSTQQVSNFTTLNFGNSSESVIGTHFEGITTDGNGGYNLAADWQYNSGGSTYPAFAHISRNSNGTFGTAQWTSFSYYPGSSWTSANTVYQNYILGLYQMGTPTLDYGYVALIPYL